MRLRMLVPVLAVLIPLAAACGDSETDTSGAGTTASASGAGGAGGGGTASVNGCEAAAATDMTTAAMVTITFDFTSYTPPCVRVKAGTPIVFKGDFSAHPLVGGEYRDMMKIPDDSSPITETMTGMEAMFTIDTKGTYPYYCSVHASVGMYGAIFVE